MDVDQVGKLRIALGAELRLRGQRVGIDEVHRVEVDDVPRAARRVDEVERQPCRLDAAGEAVGRLAREAVSEPVVGGHQHLAAGGHRLEGAVLRGREAVLGAALQVEAVDLVASRLDGAEPEAAAAGPQVAQRDVGSAREGLEPPGTDASEPHARVVGHQHVERPRKVIPRQSVNLGEPLHGEALLALPAAEHHRVAAVGIVFDPRQRIVARTGGIEHVAPPGEGARTAVGEVHVAELRVDPLLEELRAPVFGPPDPPARKGRTRRDRPDVADRAFLARTGIDPHEAGRAVKILLERQHDRVAQRQRPAVGGVVALGQPDERLRAVVLRGKRIPVVAQIVEGLAEEARDVRVVVLAQRHARDCEDVGVARAVARHVVPHLGTVALAGVGAELVAQFVVVGYVVAVGAAEPLVDVAPPVAHALHGAVGQREGGLQSAPERRHLRLGHHGVALHRPEGHAEQADGRPLLPEQVAQRADDAPVEVVVLHGVAVLVGHELLEPRHRVAVDGRRGEELDALGEVHHQSVRLEVLGVDDKGNPHRAVGEAVGDVGLHRTDVEERMAGDVGRRVGIDDPHIARAHRAPLQPDGVRAPRVVLGRGAVHAAEGADKQQYGHQPFHFPPAFLHRYPFCSRISTTRSRWSP